MHLHICEKRLVKFGGCKETCPLNHFFVTDEIKSKLINDRFNYISLIKFYQTFYGTQHHQSQVSSRSRSKRAKREVREQRSTADDQVAADDQVECGPECVLI